MSKYSVKKPFTVLVAVVLVIVLGFVSFSGMTTDLLPSISLPYIMVITTYPGASPEKVENDVTEVLEGSLGTVNGVLNVTSTSAENYSLVVLEFEEETNMDSAMVKCSTAIDQLTDSLPDMASTPMLMELSPDMMATMSISVDYEGMDIYALSDFTQETVIPFLERQTGVASVSGQGLITETVQVSLNQAKIDQINDKLLVKVSDRLAEAKEELDKAQKELNDGRAELADGQVKLDDNKAQLESGKQELENGKQELEDKQNETSDQLGMLSAAMDQLQAYQVQLTSQQAQLMALQQARKAAVEAYEEQSGGSYENIGLAQAQMDTALNALQTAQGSLALLQKQLETSEDPALTEREEALLEALNQLLQQAMPDAPPLVGEDMTRADTLAALATVAQTLEENKAQLQTAADGLTQMQNAVASFDNEAINLQLEIEVTKAIVQKYEEQLSAAGMSYQDIEAAKIQAAAGFGAASAQIAAGQAQLESAQAQLDSAQSQLDSGKESLEDGQTQLDDAKKEYENAREEALKSANLDSLLNMSTLSGLIMAQNFSMPAGYIQDGTTQYLLKVGDSFESLEDLQGALLCNIDGVGDVRLSDVADITMIDNAGESYAKVNGNDAVLLSVFKGSTAGTSDVSKACNAAIDQLEEQYPGLRVTPLMDQGDYIKLIVDSVLSNLVFGALLAIIVLLFFLKDWRPTAVVAFSIPLSVLFAIVLMYFTNISLNIISLSGLALGIGMLVDNSIVSIENIYRLRSRGVAPARAAVQGANQVAGAVTASTITTICVFMPLVFAGGLVRTLLQDMGLTIAYSLIASLIVALTVVPAMSSTLLKNCKEKQHPLFDKMLGGYDKLLRFCLRVKMVPLLVSIGLLAFCVLEVVQMGIVMLPDMGGNQMIISASAPEGGTDNDNFQYADQVMARVAEVDGVEIVGAASGSTAMGAVGGMLGSMGSDNSSFSFYVMLTDEGSKNSAGVQSAIETATAGLGGELSVSSSAMDMSALTGSGVEVDIYGDDLDTLLQISSDVIEMVDGITGFENATNGQEDGDTEIHVIVNKDEAMRLGLTVAQIYSELSAALDTSTTSTTLSIAGESYTVEIVDKTGELSVGNLFSHAFETTKTDEDGKQTKETHLLSEFANRRDGQSVNSIARTNQARTMAVTADTAEGYNTTLLSRQLEEKIAAYDLPDGYSMELGGETSSVTDMLQQMGKMISLALVFIYLVMVAQFQSLLSPFIVIFTIPLAFTGGLLGLLLTGEDLSLVSLMGFLVLSGVVVNNGIVFVDYTNQLRLAGMEKREALVATGKTRMRPILMTAMTTILAMFTMIFSNDAGSAMGRGMAIVVVGGLVYATLMTLFIVPVMYDIFFRKKEMAEVDVGEDDVDELLDDAAEFVREATEKKQAEQNSETRAEQTAENVPTPENPQAEDADHE